MAAPLFRFGAFRLDPHARELVENGRRVDLPLSTIDCLIYLIRHRDRPIGRDELASAVWGRVDVSEVSLSHAIMRLRRVLGDDGNAQRIIRTVPRLGYRWVMDDVREEPVGEPPRTNADPPTDAPHADGAAHANDTFAMATSPFAFDAGDTPATGDTSAMPIAPTNPGAAIAEGDVRLPRRSAWRSPLAIAVVAASIVVGALVYRSTRPDARAPAAAAAVSANTAVVLPVAVDAGENSAWMRLGLMDLVATQLRRGDIATTPSESVVVWLKSRGSDGDPDPREALPANWLVRGRVGFAHGVWTMQLGARDARRSVDITTHANDALTAARNAADELLIRLGRTPPSDDNGDAALAAATLRQRVNAAVLTGQLDIARRLIEQAPAAAQASPEIALAQARVALSAGDHAGSRAQAEALLARLPADAPADLRARALNTVGSASFRQGLLDEAERAFGETRRVLKDASENDANASGVLADAYRGSGSVASERDRLEDAAQAYGRARTLYELGNDPFGVASVDLNLGINAVQRDQPATALPILEGVRARMRRLAAVDALGWTEVTLVEVQLQLLDHDGALATSETFAAPGGESGNPRRRAQFIFARAAALAGAGRLDEADALLARLRDVSDADADAIARALGDGLSADISLQRGDPAKAAELAAAAQTPALEQRNRAQYAQAALVRVAALQKLGELAAAASELARMRAWNATAPEPATDILIALADAGQAAAEGDRERALRAYADAMARATARAVPEEIVRVGLPYVRELIAAHRMDEAVAVNGRIAPWADRDMRAAWSEALVYSALGRAAAADAALERARRLAGARAISDVVTASH